MVGIGMILSFGKLYLRGYVSFREGSYMNIYELVVGICPSTVASGTWTF